MPVLDTACLTRLPLRSLLPPWSLGQHATGTYPLAIPQSAAPKEQGPTGCLNAVYYLSRENL